MRTVDPTCLWSSTAPWQQDDWHLCLVFANKRVGAERVSRAIFRSMGFGAEREGLLNVLEPLALASGRTGI
jgi:hypothetical protein